MNDKNISLERQAEIKSNSAAIQQLLTPKDKNLGGFTVRRCVPNQGVRHIGPWVFFDHLGPASFPIGEGVNVRPHPHINLATVTYLFDGEMLHQDSLGNIQTIHPYDLNLMVAGSGIVHSERQSNKVKSRPHSIHGLQLWLALPELDEETAPAFYHYAADELPALNVNGVAVRVLIGSAYGVTSPVKTFSPTLYIEARLSAGQSLTLPKASMRGLYILKGEISIQDLQIPQHRLALLHKDAHVTITAECDTQLVLIGGDELGQRYIDWNFVSSSQERIEQARQQWIEHKFPEIPSDNQEYMPYPEAKR